MNTAIEFSPQTANAAQPLATRQPLAASDPPVPDWQRLPQQFAQPFQQPATRRGKPLLPVRGECSLIDKDEDETLKLIEEGKIAFAWDVALAPTRARSKELRILPAAVADYMRNRACKLKWADVLALVVPHDGPELLSRQITRALNISGELLYNLTRAKVLEPCSTWSRGPHGCAHFHRQTLVDFLEKRRWP
jgi:hypothetical protein